MHIVIISTWLILFNRNHISFHLLVICNLLQNSSLAALNTTAIDFRTIFYALTSHYIKYFDKHQNVIDVIIFSLNM